MSAAAESQKSDQVEWLASLPFETRFSVAWVWAKHAENAVGFDPAKSYEGTMFHLRWALGEIERLTTELAASATAGGAA